MKAKAVASSALNGAFGQSMTNQPSTPDEKTAVEFYRLNPSAALFDFRQRIHGTAPPTTDRFEPKDEALIRTALVHLSNNTDHDRATRNRAYALFQVLRQESNVRSTK